MVKVFIPINKGKIKTSCRGFWLSDNGKIYYDYIKVINYRQENIGLYYQDLFLNYLETIKNCYKQQCIFYIINDIGYIYHGRDRIEILKNRIYQEVKKENLKNSIKKALKDYKGVTIYQENKKYFLEVFYK